MRFWVKFLFHIYKERLSLSSRSATGTYLVSRVVWELPDGTDNICIHRPCYNIQSSTLPKCQHSLISFDSLLLICTASGKINRVTRRRELPDQPVLLQETREQFQIQAQALAFCSREQPSPWLHLNVGQPPNSPNCVCNIVYSDAHPSFKCFKILKLLVPLFAFYDWMACLLQRIPPNCSSSACKNNTCETTAAGNSGCKSL